MVFLVLCGCGREITEPTVDVAEEKNIEFETFIENLMGEAEIALAIMPDETESLDMPSDYEMRPGKQTLLNFLITAKAPLGHTMYVWGGGWNEEDTAAGEEARSIGESPRWQEFPICKAVLIIIEIPDIRYMTGWIARAT